MSKSTLASLQNVLKHFTLEGLSKNAINQLQDINWDDVIKEHDKMKLPLSRNNVVNTMFELIKALELNEEYLIETVENLKLLAMVTSKTKSWQTHKLINQSARIPLSLVELNSRLERRLRQLGQSTEIHSINHDGKFVIQIKILQKQRKKSIETKAQPPIFIIFHPATNYIFSNKILRVENLNSALAKSLGFQSIKIIKLVGKDPDELLKILLQKDHSREQIVFKEPEFIPKVKTTGSMIDCTREKEKLDYADQVYNENLVLQSLTFNVRDSPCVSEELDGEKMSASMTLTAPNVQDMLKHLVGIGAIDTPVPTYLKDVMKKGKNTFDIGNAE